MEPINGSEEVDTVEIIINDGSNNFFGSDTETETSFYVSGNPRYVRLCFGRILSDRRGVEIFYDDEREIIIVIDQPGMIKDLANFIGDLGKCEGIIDIYFGVQEDSFDDYAELYRVAALNYSVVEIRSRFPSIFAAISPSIQKSENTYKLYLTSIIEDIRDSITTFIGLCRSLSESKIEQVFMEFNGIEIITDEMVYEGFVPLLGKDILREFTFNVGMNENQLIGSRVDSVLASRRLLDTISRTTKLSLFRIFDVYDRIISIITKRNLESNRVVDEHASDRSDMLLTIPTRLVHRDESGKFM